MFDHITAPDPDPIIRIMGLYLDDTRSDKVDLGVGVYRDAHGRTPVMRAVKAAEARILETQESKGYTALAGDPAFRAGMAGLLLGGAVSEDRLACAGAPGGTGAIRQLLELVARANPDATIHVPAPTWPNHPAIIAAVGLKMAEYRYFDTATGGVDMDGMLADLGRAARGDVVVLHGCCHNPTGADPTPQDWAAIAAVLEQTGAVPFIDMAYQGLGDGPDEDAGGLRHLAARLPELLVAASGSKNFGLYRERVGLAMAICSDPARRDAVAGTMAWLNRQNFAFPPDHGARVVSTILDDTQLRGAWLDELAEMRARLQSNRRALAEALRAETGSDRFGFLAGHRGMFSLLGAGPEAVRRLRDAHAVYLVDDGRLNVAGLGPGNIARVARAIAEATG
ncbi:aromatic amino acid aminotransferase [Rhodobacteraceae bacterium WD3A24]|nr:aromatic amino acid aminotransferase [Rhodobacteraceae bacterium WD3A24]